MISTGLSGNCRPVRGALAATDVDLLWSSDGALKKLCERNPGTLAVFLTTDGLPECRKILPVLGDGLAAHDSLAALLYTQGCLDAAVL